MKMSFYLSWILAVVSFHGVSGGEFVNLTFDEPNLGGNLTPLFPGFPNGPLGGKTAELLRGWEATSGGVPISTMSISPYRVTGGGMEVGLLGNEPGSVAGRFRLILISGPAPNGPEIRISQRGTIPADAVSLLTYQTGDGISGYVNDQFIGTINFNHSIAHWDVRAFAGQEVELSIVLQANSSGTFDILGFEMIPEPSTTALLVVGGLGLGWVLVSRARAGASTGAKGTGLGKDSSH